jgi:hypothetical protein
MRFHFAALVRLVIVRVYVFCGFYVRGSSNGIIVFQTRADFIEDEQMLVY